MPNKTNFQMTVLLLAIIMVFPQISGAQESDSTDSARRIAWTPVEGARYYTVEFRRDGQIILETRTEEAWLPLFLPAGNYEFRVGVINAFGRLASQSDWSPLKLTVPSTPFILSLSPDAVYAEEIPELTLKILGLNSESWNSARYALENSRGQTINLTPDSASPPESADSREESLLIRFTPSPVPAGEWDLTVTTAQGRTDRQTAALTVSPRLVPKIRSVSPATLTAGTSANRILVTADNLEENAQVLFFAPAPDSDTPTLIPAIPLGTDEEGRLLFSINLQNIPAGRIAVEVRNPSGGTDSKARAIRVQEIPARVENQETPASPTPEAGSPPPPAYSHPNSVRLGWGPSIPLPDASNYYAIAYPAASLGYSRHLSSPRLRRIKALERLSWEVNLTWTGRPSLYKLRDISVQHFALTGGLCYITPFDFPVNLLLKIETGLGLSIHTSPGISGTTDVGGTTLNALDSADLLMRFALGSRINLGTRWYIDVHGSFEAVFYYSRTAWFMSPILQGGWRW